MRARFIAEHNQVEACARSLPSMKLRVPLEFLRVYDELRSLTPRQRCITLAEVWTIPPQSGC